MHSSDGTAGDMEAIRGEMLKIKHTKQMGLHRRDWYA